MRKLTIGEVCVGRAHGQVDSAGGDERVRVLRDWYRTRQLPEGWFAYGWNPLAPVTWDEVNWETAGERVTGAGA